MSVRIFEGTKHANLYTRFRPTIPDAVIDVVLNFLREKIPSDKWDIAVDVGCGSGQGTHKLAKHFKRCYGFDVSPAQINEAKGAHHSDNICYDVCPAEKLPLISTNSVQLLTAVEAAHWFDFNAFIQESTRVLSDNGVIALIGYMFPNPTDPCNPNDHSLHEMITDLYFDDRLAPFKNPKIVLLERHYRDIEFPKNYEFKLMDNIPTTKRVLAEDIIGYIESWSLYQGLAKADRESAEVISQEVRHKVKSILKISDLSAKEVIFNFNYFIAIARKVSNNIK